MVFITILIIGYVVGGVSNAPDCCCRGTVSPEPCICLNVNCHKLACEHKNGEIAAICCNRYINCTALEMGCSMGWAGDPLKDDYANLEWNTCEGLE